MRNIYLIILTLFFISACAPKVVIDSSKTAQSQKPSTQITVSNTALENQAATWALSLSSLPLHEQISNAMNMYQSQTANDYEKEYALYILATRVNDNALFSQQVLSRLYSNTDSVRKGQMEANLLKFLELSDLGSVESIASTTPRSQELTYPWNVIVWQAATKGLLIDSTGALDRIAQNAYFAYPTLFGLSSSLDPNATSLDGLSTMLYNPNTRYSSACVTLALPMSGNFSKIAQSISNGAHIAREMIRQAGADITLNIIDTDNPSWISQISSLPQTCLFVGGPLRADRLMALEANPALSSKAIFAFMPGLTPNLTEGSNIWRFFTSTDDQLTTILDFAKLNLGISEIASIYPNDTYSMRMSELFAQKAQSQGIYTSDFTYPLEEEKEWTKSIGEFLGSRVYKSKNSKAKDNELVPQVSSSVDAAFLPDGWNNMEMIASILHYHGATYFPLFGTTLWEQGLSSMKNIPMNYFQLAVFPGEWNELSNSYGTVNLKRALQAQNMTADNWSALGYDFVQMVSAINYNNTSVNSQEINQKLASLQEVAWAAAPFAWDFSGKAHRRLFLFQPDVNGKKILNQSEYIQNYQRELNYAR